MDGRPERDDYQAGTSTGAASPVITTGPSSSQGSFDGRFVCFFPACDRNFPTKIGLGVHQQRTHKDWYDAKQNVIHVKVRWNDEEAALLARQEARLVLEVSRFLNQDLLPFFPNRILESVKSQRRKAQYKTLILELIEELRSQPIGQTQADDQARTIPGPSLDPSALGPQIFGRKTLLVTGSGD